MKEEDKLNNKMDESKFNLNNNYISIIDNRKKITNLNKIIFLLILINIILISLLISFVFLRKNNNKNLKELDNKIDVKYLQNFISNVKRESYNYRKKNVLEEVWLKYEENMPHLRELNKKRTFENRLPLPKEINCEPHFFSQEELIGFMSFLTNKTIFFETGSGCSSIIASYYSKRVYSIEGSKYWYEKGKNRKNNNKNNYILKDLKVDDNNWSVPGKKSNIEDWKNYFQSYKKEYNADVIFIDGRFKVATAMDIFDKIKDDTVVLIHEYKTRPSYFILEEYYNYIYHWNSLYALMKKKEVKKIPLKIQKKYWNDII